MNFLLLFILSPLAATQRLTYDPRNLLPSLASPWNAINCRNGDLPPFAYPPDFILPRHLSLQQLCAQRQYGGGLQNAGGYCAVNTGLNEQRREQEIEGVDNGFRVTFETSNTGDVNNGLHNPRLRAYCHQFCECSGVRPSAQMRKSDLYVPAFRLPEYGGLQNVYIIEPDDDDALFPLPSVPFPSDTLFQTMLGQSWTEDNKVLTRYTYEYITLDPNNRIVCPQTAWLPTQTDLEQVFDSQRALCATALDGGNPWHNVGGYCRRSSLEGRTDVFFSDEFTPRPWWHWSRNNIVLNFRHYCWQVCHCATTPVPEHRPMTYVWPGLLSRSSWRGPQDQPTAEEIASITLGDPADAGEHDLPAVLTNGW
ncbi:MAG: hypothetical protein M1814_000945, partial [Vezdaea aestivalis]